MSIEASATLTCDRCEVEVVVDLDNNQAPEDAVDREGWFITGNMLDRLLCGDCYEERIMSDTSKIAKNLQAFKIAINSHDRENPDHPPAYGIEVSTFDLERLGFDDGEELWSGITIHTNRERQPHTFRVLCDYEAPRHVTDAVSEHALA